MIEELRDWLRGIAEEPGKVIAPLWTLFWLWSVARNWIKRLTAGREQTAEPAPAPPPASPPASPRELRQPAQPALPQAPRAREREIAKPAPARKAESRWPALLERAEALRSRLLHERSLRWLEPILVSEVIDPFHAAHARSRAADVATDVERRATGAVLTLQALEHVARERSTDADAAVLSELDRIAQAIHLPLSEYARAEGVALLGHTPLAVHFEANHEHYARGLTPELLFLPVPSGVGAQLSDYTSSMQALARRWFFAFPKLAEQLRDELSLSDRTRLIDPRQGFDERSAYAAFGPWLPALFAELALGLRLGNAYVTALRHQVVASGVAATRARAHGEYLSSEPPPLLRMHAALLALETLGRHDEAKRQRGALAEALPDTTEILLPIADGRHLSLPTAFMVALTEQLSRTVLDTRLDALGGVPLAEWPGFAQTLEDAREQVSLSRELIHGTPRSTDAAQLLSAAWLASDRNDDSTTALARLRKALSPRAEPATRRAEALPSARKARSLHAALHDPRTLRRAIVLGAAFSPPRSQRAPRA